jgi:capsular polysaccharide export protein
MVESNSSVVYIPFLSIKLWLNQPLNKLLDIRYKVSILPWGKGLDVIWLGWGRKRSGVRAKNYAFLSGGSTVILEDGFLRSFKTGNNSPRLSLVLDNFGIYFDSIQSSSLEIHLNSKKNLIACLNENLSIVKSLILENKLSKYNHAPSFLNSKLLTSDIQRVLLIDQTANDMSVAFGRASEDTFISMLSEARNENPLATIYIKTHPEVSCGHKKGYLTHIQDDEHTVVLRNAINPISLIEQMDRVYVVTSTMGFEALLAGKPVTCFGMPWYAGWGVTDDRQTCSRRTRTRTVDELFAAAYFHYTRYLNPVTHQRGTIFDVINWLIRQREMAGKYFQLGGPGRMICVGFRHWKAASLKPMLSLEPERVVFASSAADVEDINAGIDDCLVYWGAEAPPGLADLAKRSWSRLLRMEDGFIRSVGLGSDLIRPLSIVLDEEGIYFDPSRPSDLETILNTGVFADEELAESRKVRDFIVTHGITKYNLEPRHPPAWQPMGREIILVPGQVEDDASIRLGCPATKTNLGLLQAARSAHPDAFIVYKPHPDVVSRNRKGRMALKDALAFADYVETDVSVVSCIEACDVVHTLTSLTGFDALLRGKRVVVHGLPFYAGWGLTEDVLSDAAVFQRRLRRLSLDELVAGVLLRYPIYWDWDLKGYTTCEAVLNRIVETRSKLEANGGLQRLRSGFVRRQVRKLGILMRAWLPVWMGRFGFW